MTERMRVGLATAIAPIAALPAMWIISSVIDVVDKGEIAFSMPDLMNVGQFLFRQLMALIIVYPFALFGVLIIGLPAFLLLRNESTLWLLLVGGVGGSIMGAVMFPYPAFLAMMAACGVAVAAAFVRIASPR